MNDFACAAMIRLLTRGLEKMGLAPPAPNPRAGATVELETKRSLVAHALREGGPGALVMLGQAIHDMEADPILTMLVRVASPRQMMSRFQRLERFVHSRHRMVVEDSDDSAMSMRHISLVDGQLPLPAEDIVVLGTIIGFLQVAGCKGVTAHFEDGSPAYPDTGGVGAAFESGRTDRWTIEWKSFQPAGPGPVREPQYGLDSSPPLVRKVAHYCATDTDMTLQIVAAEFGMSARTLQRRLREAGSDFRTIAGDVRNRMAAWWLAESDRSIAEIGFICGYSDQAHFTRDFKFRNGPTPSAYRSR